ncbi:hypothetical protein Tco_0828759 [Tanacetum coccineum]
MLFEMKNERSGSLFSRQDADNFNSFIDKSGLINLPLGGRLFTWMNKAGTKLSKLDRFLISEESDFGPIPFKLFHSWLLCNSFDEVIKMELPRLGEHNFGRKLLSHEKFCLLKAIIKQRHSETKTSNHKFTRKTITLATYNSKEKEKFEAAYVDVSSVASNSGRASGSFPFTYLGLPIGSNMSLTSSWQVPEFVLNSLERSQSMFFWEGSHEARKLAWTKWENGISSYDNGGLYIGSLKAFNLALLQKSHWRSLNLYSGIFCLLAHCLEILLPISLNIDLLLDLLAILSLMFFEEVLNRFNLEDSSLIGFRPQCVRSSKRVALDSPYLLVLITEMSQSIQHVDTSLIHIESHKSPTTELFDVDSGRISIHHYEY